MPAGSPIEVRTERGSLDLFDGAENEFYFTRQIHDLNNFETRNADYSKTIKVPPTPKNIAILDAYTAAEGQGTIICSILIGGVTVAPQARLLFNSQTTSNGEVSYDVTILYGNFNLFDDILEGNINDMSWSDLAYDNTPANYVALAQNSEGLCTALADWLDRTSQRVHNPQWDIDINAAGFFIYAKEIIKRIIEEAGYTMILDASVPQRFNEIALACPVNKFYELSDPDQVAVSAEVSEASPQSATNATVRGVFQTNVSGGGLWNFLLNQWEIDTAGDLNVQLTGIYSHIETGTRPASFIRILKNGVPLTELSTDIDEADVPFLLAASTTVVPNDIIYVELQSQATQTTITLEANPQFSITTPGAAGDREVQPALYIPQIGKSDFIAEILKIFNLVMQTDDITNEVTISSFNEVFTAEEQDITNLLDVGFNDIEEMYSINSLGQISIFEWQNDNLRREDTQYQLRLPNQLLAKEVTTISSMFSACDESLNVYIGGQEGLFAKIAAVGIERESVRELTMNVQSDGSYSISEEGADLQVGMWVTLRFGGSNFQHRVIQVDTPQLGFVQTPISAVIIGNESELVEKIIGSDTSGTPRLALLLSNTNSSTGSWDAVDGARENTADFAIDAKAAYWPIELTWPNLIDSYYSDIIDALKTPQVIKAWFNLSVAVFVTLDFLKPVYIQEFNAFYYINKIEQFKYEKKTRLELVRISANTNISG